MSIPRSYTGRKLDNISFPMGGIGAGTVCLNGTGNFGSVSLRHRPEIYNEPNMFAAVTALGEQPKSRVVEVKVPGSKYFTNTRGAGRGLEGKNYGLTRFKGGTFSARFPFAELALSDDKFPLTAKVTGWSPFVPGDEDSSSLPVAALEYEFINNTGRTADYVFYYSAMNFMRVNNAAHVLPLENGFALVQPGCAERPEEEGSFIVAVDCPCKVDTALFRGGWFDPLTMLWNRIENGEYNTAPYSDPERGASPGASLAVPFTLEPGETRKITVRMCWYVPNSRLSAGESEPLEGEPFYRPWYSAKFNNIEELAEYWRSNYDYLRGESAAFADALFGGTLPDGLIDAVAANLCILKSPTILRQRDGRLWGWEGCSDDWGSCHGTCTHVWNYAQAIPYFFPRLERTLRETEYNEGMDAETGHVQFRMDLPIRKTKHNFHAASDGQLGGIIKTYRDWRISGDTEWLKKMWQGVKKSLDFCINQWDPDREGVIRQPHHNTYDIEFWGPDGMITGFYLGALKAAAAMAEAVGEPRAEYDELFRRGKEYLDQKLYNGEYYFQEVNKTNKQFVFDPSREPAEAASLFEREGPKYQYSTGCLSDVVLGIWLAELSGLDNIADAGHVESTLRSIYKYNFKPDLSEHANPQRPGFFIADEGGLLLCTWPNGGKPALPFVYSDEVWTGIEYQVASHLISKGYVNEGMHIVETCRARYEGEFRNPYDEYECGHWYARAMASYALLWAYTGARYDAVDGTMYYSLKNGRDYEVFIATATGWGVLTVTGGTPSVKVIRGTIDVKRYKELN